MRLWVQHYFYAAIGPLSVITLLDCLVRVITEKNIFYVFYLSYAGGSETERVMENRPFCVDFLDYCLVAEYIHISFLDITFCKIEAYLIQNPVHLLTF